MNFEELGLTPEMLKAINSIGLKKPTLIQERSIPHVIRGKDIVGESATGSGKTFAFGTGIIEKTEKGKGLQALVLVPTRELAEQVKEALKQLAYYKRLSIIAVYGGVSIDNQINLLQNAEVVIATPGRLLDHISRSTINLANVKILVLDEADRMLDMGFVDDVEKIIKECPKSRQTMFFSATISSGIKNLIEKHMKNPVRISAAKMVDPKKLKQVYYDVERNMKLSLLVHLLKQSSGLKMIFCNSRNAVDFVSKSIKANNIKAIAIHGGHTQSKRNKTIEMFNDSKTDILVCTDVAARGLDIEGVEIVYNYDIPKDPKDYVHRIGRTARAGKEGMVINLLCPEDHSSFARILSEYREFSIEKRKRPYVERIRRTHTQKKPLNKRPWRRRPYRV